MDFEELKVKYAELVDSMNKTKEELETAHRTTQLLKEKNERLTTLNTELWARVPSVDGNTQQKEETKKVSFEEAIDNIVAKAKKK